MEAVDGLMQRLKLSEKEKKGIRIEGRSVEGSKAKGPQAVGKVLSEKAVRAEVLEAALGKVWCPRSGVECRDLGENRFLFTFLQASGKRRALEEGPWMLSKELVVMADFDGSKTIDEIEFNHIPIWVRVTRMPLGLMNKWYGEVIGNKVGQFMEMEKEEDGSAVGQYLRIKVRLDIGKPLMRGVTLCMEEEGKEKEVWCPLVYEFLPDFCYSCGIIGHTERMCEEKEVTGGFQQYSSNLRYIPRKRSLGDIMQNQSWRQRPTQNRDNRQGHGDTVGTRRESSQLFWWKEGKDGAGKHAGETSAQDKGSDLGAVVEARGTSDTLAERIEGGSGHANVCMDKEKSILKNLGAGGKNVVQDSILQTSDGDGGELGGVKEKKKLGSYKRFRRESGEVKATEGETVGKGGKRKAWEGLEEMEVDLIKKGRVEFQSVAEQQSSLMKAGSADRSCGKQ